MSVLDNLERGLDHGDDLPWPILRAVVLLRDEFTCAICGEYATQADHIFPRCFGGSDHPLNLQALCQPCNQGKGRKLLADWDSGTTWAVRYFGHLTLPQMEHYVEECGAHRERLTMQVRFLGDRCHDLQAGVVTAGDPIDLERHNICPTCSVDGVSFHLHGDQPCPKQAAT